MKQLIRKANEVMAEHTQLVRERKRMNLEIRLWTQQTLQRHKRIFKWDNDIFAKGIQVSGGDSEPPIRIATSAPAISRKAIARVGFASVFAEFASAFLSFADKKREFAAAKVAFADEK